MPYWIDPTNPNHAPKPKTPDAKFWFLAFFAGLVAELFAEAYRAAILIPSTASYLPTASIIVFASPIWTWAIGIQAFLLGLGVWLSYAHKRNPLKVISIIGLFSCFLIVLVSF